MKITPFITTVTVIGIGAYNGFALSENAHTCAKTLLGCHRVELLTAGSTEVGRSALSLSSGSPTGVDVREPVNVIIATPKVLP